MDNQVLSTKDKVNRTSAVVGVVLITLGIIFYFSDYFLVNQLLYPIFFGASLSFLV